MESPNLEQPTNTSGIGGSNANSLMMNSPRANAFRSDVNRTQSPRQVQPTNTNGIEGSNANSLLMNSPRANAFRSDVNRTQSPRQVQPTNTNGIEGSNANSLLMNSPRANAFRSDVNRTQSPRQVQPTNTNGIEGSNANSLLMNSPRANAFRGNNIDETVNNPEIFAEIVAKQNVTLLESVEKMHVHMMESFQCNNVSSNNHLHLLPKFPVATDQDLLQLSSSLEGDEFKKQFVSVYELKTFYFFFVTVFNLYTLPR